MITNIDQLDLKKRYTYADYLTWQFREMVELIRGKVVQMSPAPSAAHQRISGSLNRIISTFLLGKPCEVFAAPFDVRLPLPPGKQTDDKVDTVVQPDLSIICDPAKIDDRGCNGAPDWIIEILSQSTSQVDLTDKFEVYQYAGVREYWIIHPYECTVLTYRLNAAGKYEPVRINPFVKGEELSVGIFPDFSIHLDEVFPRG